MKKKKNNNTLQVSQTLALAGSHTHSLIQSLSIDIYEMNGEEAVVLFSREHRRRNTFRYSLQGRGYEEKQSEISCSVSPFHIHFCFFLHLFIP